MLTCVLVFFGLKLCVRAVFLQTVTRLKLVVSGVLFSIAMFKGLKCFLKISRDLLI